MAAGFGQREALHDAGEWERCASAPGKKSWAVGLGVVSPRSYFRGLKIVAGDTRSCDPQIKIYTVKGLINVC